MSELKWPSEEEVRKMFAKKEGFGSDATLSAAMELPEVRALGETMAGLKRIVEEIDGAMNHGTWRDEKGMRMKDTPEWVSAYVALAAIKEPKT